MLVDEQNGIDDAHATHGNKFALTLLLAAITSIKHQ